MVVELVNFENDMRARYDQHLPRIAAAAGD
jgi:hypothetical protein